MTRRKNSRPFPSSLTGSTSSFSYPSNSSLRSVVPNLPPEPVTSVLGQKQAGVASNEKDRDTKFPVKIPRRSLRRKSGPVSYNLALAPSVQGPSAGAKMAHEKAMRYTSTDEKTIEKRSECIEPLDKSACLPSGPGITTSHVNPVKSKKPTKRYELQGLYINKALPSHENQAITGISRKAQKTSPALGFLTTGLIALPTFPHLEEERSFVIPYDVFAPIYRQRGEAKPEDWIKLHKNRLVGDAKDYWKKPYFETSSCVCTSPASGSPDLGCDEDSLNRAMDYECDSGNCALGYICTNRAFAELGARMKRAKKVDKESALYLFNFGVEVIKTPDRGFGVRACRSYEPDQIITEYTGEIITSNEAGRRIREDHKDKTVSLDSFEHLWGLANTLQAYYQMNFDQGMVLDSTKGSIARFVNHSCEPNCKMLKRFVGCRPRMALFAGDRGILTGEELTYDYKFAKLLIQNFTETELTTM
ncbi:SET domain-containing protein [Aureobasidium pullulans]|nr:SET domain-containing protein [Aureobasidium pullulans]